MTALYSAASQLNELDDAEKSLRDLQKVLKKPKVVDFMETSLISRAGKSKLMIAIAKEAGMLDFYSTSIKGGYQFEFFFNIILLFLFLLPQLATG